VRAGGPRPWTSDGTLCGVYYGIVCQNKDTEKKLGRVKVRFPWMPGGDQDQAQWAQLATPMCGNKFGWWILPEIDDVVAVVFVGGDIWQPVVLGGIWSKTDTPPEPVQDGKNEFRGYRSRCGHRFLLDDSSKVKVSWRDKSNALQLTVGELDKGGNGPNAHDAVKCGGAASSGVAATSTSGKLNIFCPDGKLTIEGQKVEIRADDKMDIKATGELSFKGSGSAECVSSQAGKYEGATTKLG
jgi:uncharacterized protein involved in type VI secretion and phage assembly